MKVLGEDLKQAMKAWSEDKISLHASSLAYYTVFSIAPLLVLAIAVAGFFLGDQASRGEILGEVQALVGVKAAASIQSLVQGAASQHHSGIVATVISVITLVAGASGVFQQLQDSLNTIWRVEPPKDAKIGTLLQKRLLTFAMVGVIDFLLLVSLIASAAVAAIGKFLGTSAIWHLINFLASVAVITVLLASVYRFLPDVRLLWRDLWGGAFLTAILFSIGKWAIGLYLGRASIESPYGAAGSLVVLLVWVYYSAQILFFGAEFTRVVTERKRRAIPPPQRLHVA